MRTSGFVLLLVGMSVGCSSNTAVTTDAIEGVTLSAPAFDFGNSLAGSSVSKQVVAVTNPSTRTLLLSPAVTGDASYSLVGAQSCGATLAPGASCSITVAYAPSVAAGNGSHTGTVDLGLKNVPAGTSQTVALTGTSTVLAAGTVSPTANPQVALYTLNLPSAGSATVNFGPSTAYGRQTWTKSLTSAGTVSFFVAGMLPQTDYHLQASVQLINGSSTRDTDHVFTTGTPPFQPTISANTTAGMTPQPGLEQLSIRNGIYFSLAVADLQGNIVWSYALPNNTGQYQIEGAKLMSNGDFLVTLGQGSDYSLTSTVIPEGTVKAIREIDLGGNTVREITIDSLNSRLQTAGYNITLQQFHHDVLPLPNGHWLVLSNTSRTFTDLTGIPGQTTVLGDVVVDLDTNLNPVWVWNEFDHLDVNRHPYLFPDWTHTNALVYSPSDGNLPVSMRHQNWVIKVDYANGAGSGNVLWRLGQGGDFKLVNGTDPTDWNYAQHLPSFFSASTSGVFSLGLMDNGDDRQFPSGVVCGTAGQPTCLYTTVPVYQIDENAKTATLTSHYVLPSNLYSFFGGNAELLTNGHVEYDLSGLSDGSGQVFEVTPAPTPQTVWTLRSASWIYRGYRIPSLYPGVQW